jgi:hypothetical protein
MRRCINVNSLRGYGFNKLLIEGWLMVIGTVIRKAVKFAKHPTLSRVASRALKLVKFLRFLLDFFKNYPSIDNKRIDLRIIIFILKAVENKTQTSSKAKNDSRRTPPE